MGLLLIVLGFLIWLLVAPVIGIILIVIGVVVLLAGFGTGHRYY